MQNGPLSYKERVAFNQESLHGQFDEVFLVNLVHDRAKRIGALKHFQSHGIYPRLWTATHGHQQPTLGEYLNYRKRPLAQLQHCEFNRVERSRGSLFIDSPGVLGYIRTYESLICHALKNKLKRILVFEDDTVLAKDFGQKLGDFLANIDRSWKILHLGASQYDWTPVEEDPRGTNRGFYHPEIFATCGSFAMGLDSSIYAPLLENLKQPDSPFDQIPLGLIYREHREKCFVAYPNLVVADVRSSTIRNERSQGEHAEKMRWDMGCFTFPRPQPTVSILVPDFSRIGLVPGKSQLESAFRVNWLHYSEHGVRPVHEWRPCEGYNPSVESSGVAARRLGECLSHLAQHMSDDYLLILESGQDFSDRTLTDTLEQLVMGHASDEQGILAYVRKESGYAAFRVEEAGHEIGIQDDGDVHPNFLDDSLGHNLRSFVDHPCKHEDQDSALRPPKVSVIIPTYRRAENLAAAVSSVLDQTYQNLEIFVVDDNEPQSEDRQETALVMRSFEKDDRVRFIQLPKNMGGAAARNVGLYASTGDYICFLDDDDVFLPKKIEESVRVLERLNMDYGGVYCGFHGWNSLEENAERYLEGNLTPEVLKLQYRQHYLHTCTAMYRKEALIRINGFDESFRRHQDLELNLRFFEHYKMGVVPKVLVHIRPEKTNANNFLQGAGLYGVKKKYLEKFRSTIERLPEQDQREVYRANWLEVIELFESRAQVIEFCRTHADDTFLRELIPLLSFDSDAVLCGDNSKLDFTVENIQDLYPQLEAGNPLPSKLRELPRMLCELLDVRWLHQNGNRAGIAEWLRNKMHFRRGVVGLALHEVFEIEADPNWGRGLTDHDRCLAAHIRQLVMGPTLSQSVRRQAWLGLNPADPLSSGLIVQVDPALREFVDLTGPPFKVGPYDCVKLMKNGLLIHPNSDRDLVYVKLRAIPDKQGHVSHCIVSLSNASSSEVEIYVSPSLRRLSRQPIATIRGGTSHQWVEVPKPLHRQWQDGFYMGVKMREGSKPDGARLMLTGVAVMRN